jgi:hypothetical protein
MIKKTFFALSLTFMAFFASATTPSVLDTTPIMPHVFQLGQYDGAPFENMKGEYEVTLASACKNDMELAYYSWVHLLKHMESYAGRTGFDINGVKLWLYIFWSKDGNIDYVAYYPKPNSRNMKEEEMTSFLTEFVKNYTFPIKNDKNFSNYSSANFPVMIEKNNSGGSAPTVNGKGNGNGKGGSRE